ncbi:MAG: tetratricopeptide repeat protein [Bacteroidales bacterium]|nr:tetratricopeptide repeat protein [Bacteroidales bacterium]
MEEKELNEINSIIKKLNKAELKGDALQIFLCCDALADIYASNYDAEMAIALYQKAIDVLQEAGAPRRMELATAYYKQGLYLQDKYYRALPCFKNALDLFSQLNDESGIASCNFRIGRLTLNKSIIGEDFADIALPYFNTAVELFGKVKDADAMASALTYKGLCEINIDKLKEAEEDLENAVSIAQQINEPEILDDALYHLARAYYKGEKFFKGQKLLERALEINRKSKDYEDLSYMLQTYGEILVSLEKFDEAIEAFKESEQIKRTKGYTRDLPETILWLGKTYFYMEKLPEALLYFQEEASLRNEAETENLATAYGNMGFICMKLGYTRDAINHYFNKLKTYGDDDNYAMLRADTLCDLAEAHVANNENEIAVKVYQKALDEWKLALKLKQVDDADAMEKINERIAELDEEITQKDEELPKIDVPEVLTDDYIADILRTMVADVIMNSGETSETSRQSIGFRHKNTAKFSDDATFESLGADDIDIVQICVNAERLFDIELPEDMTDDITTTAELIEAVKELIDGAV